MLSSSSSRVFLQIKKGIRRRRPREREISSNIASDRYINDDAYFVSSYSSMTHRWGVMYPWDNCSMTTSISSSRRRCLHGAMERHDGQTHGICLSFSSSTMLFVRSGFFFVFSIYVLDEFQSAEPLFVVIISLAVIRLHFTSLAISSHQHPYSLHLFALSHHSFLPSLVVDDDDDVNVAASIGDDDDDEANDSFFNVPHAASCRQQLTTKTNTQ